MGSLNQGTCYPTPDAAKKAICSNAGQMQLDGGNFYASACIATDFSLPTFEVARAINGSLLGVDTFSYPEFLPCDHTYSGGLIAAWLAAALLLAVTLWGLRKLMDLFSGKFDA